MGGTHSVASVLRLCLGAALLCVAWILLSASTADAAERPAPVERVVPLAEGVAPLADAAAPLTSQLRAATASAVDTGAAAVKSVAAAAAPVAPVLERPVSDVADTVVAVVDAVPVVGRDAIVTVPLPQIPEGSTPLPFPAVTIPVGLGDPALPPLVGLIANSSALHQDSLVGRGPATGSASLTSPAVSPDDLRLDEAVAGGPDRARPASDTSDPPGQGEPQPPGPSSPMPPTSPGPGPGGGASPGDLAALVPAMVIPEATTGGCTSMDWPVPQGLPAQPGSRPD